MPNYRIDFVDKNIFDILYPYKIRCIGKQISNDIAIDATTRYYFLAHRQKYQVTEIVENAQNFNVTLECVDDFTLDEDANSYLFTKEIEEGIKKDIAEEYKELAYHKDGFYIFKDIILKSGYPYIGGIVDTYEFENCTVEELRKRIEEST